MGCPLSLCYDFLMPARCRIIIARLGVSLLLISGGAIVNVAVAWGCAIWTKLPTAWTSDTPRVFAWPAGVPSKWPERPTRCIQATHCFRTRTVLGADSDTRTRRGVRTHCDDTGVPLRCLRSVELEGWYGDMSHVTPAEGIFDGGLKPPPSLFGSDIATRRRLPLSPLWPGFAINTIFYAAILWLLWIALGRARRFIRVRRGRCPACGYQIAAGVGPVCSECGQVLAKQP
jgi:hypothetical protein